MSKPTDTMKKYETGTDRGDENKDASQPGTPAEAPVPATDQPSETGTDHTDQPSYTDPSPIPQAEPQSPVQTEDSPNVSASKDVHEHSGERGKGNLSGQEKSDTGTNREYREVKDHNL